MVVAQILMDDPRDLRAIAPEVPAPVSAAVMRALSKRPEDRFASLDELLRILVPSGFFVPVTPGTRMVSVGGAIAADVHGKNHHVDGTFGSHVSSLGIVDGRGDEVVLTPDGDPERFWATVGGMGLTGVITEATFDLIPISSSRISVDTERATDLDDVMDRMIARDDEYRYSVAWIDSVHPSGRGVLTRGGHAPAE